MRMLCVSLIFTGAFVLSCSIVFHYRLLNLVKTKTHEEKMFTHWVYVASMLLMIFFFIGYVFTGTLVLVGPLTEQSLLVSFIFFFGALFTFIAGTVQKSMIGTISDKTEEIVRTLVNAVEAKDSYTRGHSDHVYNIVKIFAVHLPAEILSQIKLPQLLDAAILHDIGKIGIDESVLNKPGSLSDEEWQSIREHPWLGAMILKNTSYHKISEIIYSHHERVDGNGYYGISFNEVPMEAKIIAVADTFSAIYTDRVYRPRQSFERAMEILKEAAGTQLDRELVEIFCAIGQEELDKASVVFSEQISFNRDGKIIHKNRQAVNRKGERIV